MCVLLVGLGGGGIVDLWKPEPVCIHINVGEREMCMYCIGPRSVDQPKVDFSQ